LENNRIGFRSERKSILTKKETKIFNIWRLCKTHSSDDFWASSEHFMWSDECKRQHIFPESIRQTSFAKPPLVNLEFIKYTFKVYLNMFL